VRWLALALILLSGEALARKVVIREPPIVRACPDGKSWSAVETCLRAQGTITIERSLPKAKLVHVMQERTGGEIDDAGVYLYIARADGSWAIGGMFDGGSFSVMDLAPLTIANHAGYKLDIGQIMRTTISLDGVTSMPAIVATKRVLFCSGSSYGCPDATTQCDVIVHGKTLWTFRGTITFEPGVARVVGDRTKGGAVCVPTEQVYLGWPVAPKLVP
jgi:hypothetical protein